MRSQSLVLGSFGQMSLGKGTLGIGKSKQIGEVTKFLDIRLVVTW